MVEYPGIMSTTNYIERTARPLSISGFQKVGSRMANVIEQMVRQSYGKTETMNIGTMVFFIDMKTTSRPFVGSRGIESGGSMVLDIEITTNRQSYRQRGENGLSMVPDIELTVRLSSTTNLTAAGIKHGIKMIPSIEITMNRQLRQQIARNGGEEGFYIEFETRPSFGKWKMV
jgi:hypothetical protein